jgi:hypothetical protein
VLLYWVKEGDQQALAGALKGSVRYLGRHPDEAVLDAVLAHWTDDASGALRAALLAALEWVPASRIPTGIWASLQRGIKSPDTPPILIASILEFAVNSSGSERNLKGAERLLESKEPVVRGLACQFLGKSRNSEVVAQLITKTKDESPHVRAQASWALSSLSATAAIPALLELIDDEAPTAAQIEGGAGLDGLKLKVTLPMVTRANVAVSAMLALEQMSEGDLKLNSFGVAPSPDVMVQNRALVRDWAAKRKKAPL